MAGAGGSWRGRRGAAYPKGVAFGPAPSFESALPHFPEPRERGSLQPAVPPWRVGSPAQVTAPRARRPRRPPSETSPGARSPDLSEPQRLPAEEEGLSQGPSTRKTTPSPFFSFAVSSSSSIFPPLHTLLSSSPTRFRTSRHKLQRQLCSLRGWELLLPFGICKTLWSGKSMEGLSPRFPLPRVCTERASWSSWG